MAHNWIPILWVLIFLVGCPVGPRPTLNPQPSAPFTLEVIPRKVHVSHHLSMTGEQSQVLFHLNLRNTASRPLDLDRVELLGFDQHGALLSHRVLRAALLTRRLRKVGWVVMDSRQSIAAAHRQQGLLKQPKGDTRVEGGATVGLLRLLYLGREDDLPRRIQCRVYAEGKVATRSFVVHRHRQRTRLRLPCARRWWVVATHRYDEPHGSAILSSQNYAYDLAVLGNEQTTYFGDPRSNEAYHASGRSVLAAAAGKVVSVHGGVPENRPVGRRPAWQSVLLNPATLAGNHVVIEHEAGEHSVYMHLKPELRVKAGQQVQAGQLIGHVGNSGNSLEPHLHFQLQDGPDLFRANGLPARFGDFTLHLAHLKVHVSAARPMPLPLSLAVEPGRVEGAAPIERVLR